MININWINPAQRFVAFFDIMGFKKMVERENHEVIVKKLKKIKNALSLSEGMNNSDEIIKGINVSETKGITFSDSIVIFSKADTLGDAIKILFDSYWILQVSLENKIAINGVISYGKITFDIENSLFFGKPIIDAYLLHKQLQLYAVVFDHNFETKIDSLKIQNPISQYITRYKVNLKTSKVYHKMLSPGDDKTIEKHIGYTRNLYESVSGSSRIYIDNTLEFYNSLLSSK